MEKQNIEVVRAICAILDELAPRQPRKPSEASAKQGHSRDLSFVTGLCEALREAEWRRRKAGIQASLDQIPAGVYPGL